VSAGPDISHDAEPEAYGAAMALCHGYPPACSDAGECAKEGFCFGREGAGYAKARRIISAALEKESDIFVRGWLKVALDAMEHRGFTGALKDAMLLVEINRRVRAAYGRERGGRK
jgi:hypothetical protein